MDWKCYFETDPWSDTVEQVCANRIGRVVAVCAQENCEEGRLENTVLRWQQRLKSLLGEPLRCDRLQTEMAVSVLLRYRQAVICRLFVDQGPGEPSCSFELAGTGGLLIWKPTALSTVWVRGDNGGCVFEHAYSVSLAEEMIQ